MSNDPRWQQEFHNHQNFARSTRSQHAMVGTSQLVSGIINGIKSVPEASLANDIERSSPRPLVDLDNTGFFEIGLAGNFDGSL